MSNKPEDKHPIHDTQKHPEPAKQPAQDPKDYVAGQPVTAEDAKAAAEREKPAKPTP